MSKRKTFKLKLKNKFVTYAVLGLLSVLVAAFVFQTVVNREGGGLLGQLRPDCMVSKEVNGPKLLSDSDCDGWSDDLEKQLNTRKNVKNKVSDSDNDGLVDYYEVCDSDYGWAYGDIQSFDSACPGVKRADVNGKSIAISWYCDDDGDGECDNEGVKHDVSDMDDDLYYDKYEVCDSDVDWNSGLGVYDTVCNPVNNYKKFWYCDSTVSREDFTRPTNHLCNMQGTNPLDPDTDGDKFLDGEEAGAASNPTEGYWDTYPSSPLKVDTDGDGINDLAEYFLGSDGWLEHGDSDGLNDLDEICDCNDLDPGNSGCREHYDEPNWIYPSTWTNLNTKQQNTDYNLNGRLDDITWNNICGYSRVMKNYDTDPMNSDTDGGGESDGVEVGIIKRNGPVIHPNNKLDDTDVSYFQDCRPIDGETGRSANAGEILFGKSLNIDGLTLFGAEDKACINIEAESREVLRDPFLTYKLKGWSWSDSVGWMSFDCKDWKDFATQDVCQSSQYEVLAKFPSDEVLRGYLTGYLWNSELEWLNLDWYKDWLNSFCGKPGNVNKQLCETKANYAWEEGVGPRKRTKSVFEFCKDNYWNLDSEDLDRKDSWCDYMPQMRLDTTDEEGSSNWKMDGYAWSPRGGWVNLGGPLALDWNPMSVWAKVSVVKVVGSNGDGLMNSDGSLNQDAKNGLGADFSSVAVAGLPLYAEGIELGCNDGNYYADHIDDNTLTGCRSPLSGYQIRVALGIGISDDTLAGTALLAQIRDNAHVKIILNTQGEIYPLQAQKKDGEVNVFETEGDLKTNNSTITSALRWGPTGYSDDENDDFVKVGCDVAWDKNGNGVLDPIEFNKDMFLGCYMTDKDAPINPETNLMWVKTITSAAPTGGVLGASHSSKLNSFKIKDIQINFKFSKLGTGNGIQLDLIDGKTLNACPADTPSDSALCGVYEGEFRFLPPVEFNMKQIYNGSALDYIVAWVNEPITLSLMHNSVRWLYKYVAEGVIGTIKPKLDVWLTTAESDQVNFVFDSSNDKEFDSSSDTYELFAATPINFVSQIISEKPAMVLSIENRPTPDAVVEDPRMWSLVNYETKGVNIGGIDLDAPIEVRYSAGFLPKKGTVGAGAESGIDVQGTVSIKSGVEGRTLEQNQIFSIGDVSATSSMRDQILRNVSALTEGRLKNDCSVTGSGEIKLSFDLSFKKYKLPGGSNKGCSLDNGEVLYFRCESANCNNTSNKPFVTIEGADNLENSQTIIVEGMDVYIKGDILAKDDSRTLGLIVLGKKDNTKNWYYGGNLYVNSGGDGSDEGVTGLYLNAFLDGSMMRYVNSTGSKPKDWLCEGDSTEGGCMKLKRSCDSLSGVQKLLCAEEPNAYFGDQMSVYLKNQLYIYGSLASGAVKGGNTIGGVDNPDGPILGDGSFVVSNGTGKGKRTALAVERASLYDLSRMSKFKLFFARCGDGKAIDLKTGSCIEKSEELEAKPFDGDTLEGDLVLANTTEFSELYTYCKSKNGCGENISSVIFDVIYKSSAIRSVVWSAVKGLTQVENRLRFNEPVYFVYKAPADLKGFEAVGPASTISF